MNKWTFDGGILFDENCQAIACTWECEGATGRNVRLIENSLEMYELLKEELIPTSNYGGIISFECERKIKALLARIDGEEMEHD